MFNWKKHCFICLSSMSLTMLSTFLQNTVDAYTVTGPGEDCINYWLNDSWGTWCEIDNGICQTVNDMYPGYNWIVVPLYGTKEGEYKDQFVDWINTEKKKQVIIEPKPAPTNITERPESYGVLAGSYVMPILGVGGWEENIIDQKFRFLTIDLADFTNLQAVGRNAFENLGHQQEVATVTEITVPDKCSQIEEDAWKNCTFLKKVTFLCPNITYMSPLAFDGCYDTLKEVRIAGNWTEETLRDAIDTLKGSMMQIVNDKPETWTAEQREDNANNVTDINKVPDFVATFEGHGFSWTIEEEDDGSGRFIVLRKSPTEYTEPNASEDDGTSTENDDTSNSSDDTSVEDIDEVVVSTPDSSDDDTSNPPIDIANKDNVLIDKQVYTSHDQSILTEDLRVTAPDETELPNTDYDVYLRWVKDGETSEWVKYVGKDSLKVKDAGTYTIQYVVYYKGDNPDLKSNPEGLEVNEDESGINVTINGEEIK